MSAVKNTFEIDNFVKGLPKIEKKTKWSTRENSLGTSDVDEINGAVDTSIKVCHH